MSVPLSCGNCGAKLSSDASPTGMCPQCLLQLGFENGRTDESTEMASTETQTQHEFPERIGPYKLLEVLGEGGMGIVYLAEQQEPIYRRVALKLVKRGMDTKQVIARFESERQALALMDHPAVAKVFDAGETAAGRPYFVMEHVRGVPINDYCDRHKLTIRERLELFAQVCAGVQHAHQKAVIHRDLKPSNVLVSIQDDRAVPKIIDFGVAKATAQKLTERTVYTQQGTLIGTPEYMSPEQAEMTGQNVDTRTDVYSLGVMLYELLTGALPFDPDELRRASFDEIVRKIRDDDPQKPSTRLGTLGGKAAESANRRKVDVTALRRRLRGDLDWITMKALEKDRTRRYDSPSEMAADIQRHLDSQPVLAGPPSKVYRMRKFARRHRVGVTIAVASLSLLIGFAVRERFQAVQIAAARDEARQEAETARQVSDYLVGLFQVADPGSGRGNSVTARELLDSGAERIHLGLEGQPLVQARLMDTMGRAYQSLSLFDEASELLERALEVRERELGPDHRDVAASLSNLGWLRLWQGRVDEAAAMHRRALAIRERELGDSDLETAWSLYYNGTVHNVKGELASARAYYERALPIFESAGGPDHIGVAWTLNDLAMVYRNAGEDSQVVEAFYRRALEIKERTLGPVHPDVARAIHNLMTVYRERGEYDRALEMENRVLAIQLEVLGEEHADVGLTLINIALLHLDLGDPAPARAAYERALDVFEKTWGLDQPDVLFHRGCYLAMTGAHAEALRFLRQATESGFAATWSLEDPAFDSLRGNPEFEAIIAAARSRTEE